MKLFATLTAYTLIAAMLLWGTAVTFQHEEVEGNASLICYACIGIH